MPASTRAWGPSVRIDHVIANESCVPRINVAEVCPAGVNSIGAVSSPSALNAKPRLQPLPDSALTSPTTPTIRRNGSW
ncbi:hypothetical protein D3C83_28940 [compost metagenome]